MTPAETIAAEVAAKYGVPVSPSVVKVLPPRTSTPVDYVWNGYQLVGKEPPRAKMRAQIHADASSRKRDMTKANQTRAEALAKRDAAVRHYAAQGLSAREIADKFGISVDAMRQFMNRQKIDYVRGGRK